ncbi:hypothetical protein LshimejAT787_0308020 [Lyophyllum shimeji]|uniref:Uncharacterized protein n=1 Tax=Lyophyllum shimeji TaxID=47721 RepID=A0A9P3PJC4_LYOSH|nr:hypothetical protein LshimejAT787_0308020 [Lyophyllum shimeji]
MSSSSHKNIFLGSSAVKALRTKAAYSLHLSVIPDPAPRKGIDQVEGSGLKSRLASKFPKQVSRKNVPAQCYYAFQ